MKETNVESSNLSRPVLTAKFFAESKPPQEAIDHFAAIKWTNTWLSDPNYTLVPTFSRHLKNTGEDYYFSRTINSPSTIPHMITLARKDLRVPSEGTGFAKKATGGTRTGGQEDWYAANPQEPQLVVLIQFGDMGVDGHPHTLHGGVTSAILDEMMSFVIMVHRRDVPPEKQPGSLYTVNLNVNFRAAITTPSQVLMKCWLLGWERRKWMTRGIIVDENNRVLAQGDALWVEARKAEI